MAELLTDPGFDEADDGTHWTTGGDWTIGSGLLTKGGTSSFAATDSKNVTVSASTEYTFSVVMGTITDSSTDLRLVIEERTGGSADTEVVTALSTLSEDDVVSVSHTMGGSVTAARVTIWTVSAAAAYSIKSASFDLAASPDVEVDTNLETLALTENAATIAVDVNVSGSLETISLTENQATISNDTNVASSLDTLALTEYAATIEFGINVAASLETLAITENQASISNDSEVSASTESLAITEYQASVTAAGTGNPQDTSIVTRGYYFGLNADIVTRGYNQLTQLAIDASLETLTLTEYATTITYDVDVPASTDALVLTEYQASVVVDSGITTATASISLTEYSASIELLKEVTASTDSLTLTEYQADIGGDREIDATAEVISLTTYRANAGLILPVSPLRVHTIPVESRVVRVGRK